jgi:hypothetical protein
MVSRLGEPRDTGEIYLTSGTTNVIRGDLVKLELDQLGWTSGSGKLLRVTDVNHSFDQTGWHTNINVKEDEKVLTG